MANRGGKASGIERLLEMMEEDGVVGPFVGSKSRDVLLTLEEWKAREAAPSSISLRGSPRHASLELRGNAHAPSRARHSRRPSRQCGRRGAPPYR